MPSLTCPACHEEQEVKITVDTYSVKCENCGELFDIPRQHRVDKPQLVEYKSSVNIRVGYREADGSLTVGWTVQSAEKNNQYLEKQAVSVDVSNHPQKTYWYVAVFKALQHVNEYKSARIWIKHDQVIGHLAGEFSPPEDDLRNGLAENIIQLCDEKFLGYEFGTTSNVGTDIKKLIS